MTTTKPKMTLEEERKAVTPPFDAFFENAKSVSVFDIMDNKI